VDDARRDALARRTLIEPLWQLPEVRNDLSAAAREAFDAGDVWVPSDLLDAARADALARRPIGRRMLHDGAAYAFVLDAVRLEPYVQVLVFDADERLKHFAVNLIPDEGDVWHHAWSIAGSVTAKAAQLGLTPQLAVSRGGRRHVVTFSVERLKWQNIDLTERQRIVATLFELARDNEQVSVAHHGPVLLRLTLADANSTLRNSASTESVYEEELPPI